MKKIKKYIVIVTIAMVAFSCKKFDTLLDNPNLPTPTSADVDLYLNQVQLSARTLFSQADGLTAPLVRMYVYFGPTYSNGYGPVDFNSIWGTAYEGVLKNANAMIPVAKSQAKYYHAGIAEILKAYTLFTLVDLFGDVPYSEANLGVANQNPKADPGASVYKAAMDLLDSALLDLGKTPASYPPNVLFSPSIPSSGTAAVRAAPWIKVANTLKLRAYVNTRLVDNTVGAKIQALAGAYNGSGTSSTLISTTADEFTFKYGNKQSTPNSRHPRYNNNYVASGGAGDYVGVYFMYALRFEKGITDPRTRYYFYRQTTSSPGNVQQQPCAYQAKPAHYGPNDPFCEIGVGYWGRNHGDNSGIPPDGTLRTVPGVYPAGGKFDCSESVATTLNEGGKGAGIEPIWMSFFTDFTLAEAALTTTGYTGDARTLLLNGVTKSINRVMAFPAEVGTSACTAATPSSTAVTNYINFVMAQYDAATTTSAKLDVVLKEYYIALWGNGLDAYNMYRRTSRPRGLQPTILPNPGAFIRSFLYPSDYVNLNTNAKQKTDWAQKVFWDTNPDPLF